MQLDIDTLKASRRQHPAWRLLAAESAALAASFLHQVFVTPNRRVIAQADMAGALIDRDVDVDAGALYSQFIVDKAALAQHVRQSLQQRAQVTLAELVAYLSLAAEPGRGVIDNTVQDGVAWVSHNGQRKRCGCMRSPCGWSRSALEPQRWRRRWRNRVRELSVWPWHAAWRWRSSSISHPTTCVRCRLEPKVRPTRRFQRLAS